ncbi:MAG: hypothetical protein DRH11_07595, partial [Deltaproteobacteria bacterium]
ENVQDAAIPRQPLCLVVDQGFVLEQFLDGLTCFFFQAGWYIRYVPAFYLLQFSTKGGSESRINVTHFAIQC